MTVFRARDIGLALSGLEAPAVLASWSRRCAAGVGVAFVLAFGAAVVAVHPAMAGSSPDSLDGLFEGMQASDVLVSEVSLSNRWRSQQRDVGLKIGWASMEVDYTPAAGDLLGTDGHRGAGRTSLQADWRGGLGNRFSPFASIGGYDGFTDFRSLWIDEYYRQLFAPMAGYGAAVPRGYNGGVGLRWDHVPGTGFLEFSAGWQTDQVSPAYDKEVFGPLLRGRDTFATWRGGLAWESVLSSRLRARADFGLNKTTARAWRLNGRAMLNYAVADTWVLRFEAGGAAEGSFHGGSLAATVEHDWAARWYCGVTLRGYRDNGQISDPLVVSGAAPSLRTAQALLSLRWQGERAGWRLSAGPYLTRYSALTPASQRFANLYRDRNWGVLQLAGTLDW